jgi:hypothetical protein
MDGRDFSALCCEASARGTCERAALVNARGAEQPLEK